MAQPIVVNNPGSASETGSGLGYLLGAILLIALVAALFFYGLPFARQASAPSGPSVTVPEQVDVNLNQQ